MLTVQNGLIETAYCRELGKDLHICMNGIQDLVSMAQQAGSEKGKSRTCSGL